MQATVGPEKALALLQVEHDAVRALINELTAEEKTRPDTIRYGLYADQECSFKDLLAHLITYEAYALAAVDAWRQGRKHWITDAMRSPRQGREVHYGGIADRAACSLAEVEAEWHDTQSRLMALIGGMDAAAWQQPAPYADSEATDLGGMLEEILVAPPRPLYRHLPVHIPDSAAYVRSLRG